MGRSMELSGENNDNKPTSLYRFLSGRFLKGRGLQRGRWLQSALKHGWFNYFTQVCLDPRGILQLEVTEMRVKSSPKREEEVVWDRN